MAIAEVKSTPQAWVYRIYPPECEWDRCKRTAHHEVRANKPYTPKVPYCTPHARAIVAMLSKSRRTGQEGRGDE